MILLTSCYLHDSNNQYKTKDLLFSVNLNELHKNNEPIYYSEVFESFYLLPLETNPNCIIGNIKHIKVYNTDIFILDSYSKLIYIFQQNGKFINKVGSFGRGPREYLDPIFSFDEETNEVVVYCKQLKKIIIYKINGDFIKEFKYENGYQIKNIECHNDYIYITINPLPKDKEKHYLIYSIDKNGNEIDKWLKNRGIYSTMEVSHMGSFYRYNDKLLYNESYLDTIYYFENNKLYPYLSAFSNSASYLEEIEAIHKIKEIDKRISEMWKYKRIWGRHDLIENNQLMYFIYIKDNQSYSLMYNKLNKKISTGFFVDDMSGYINERFISCNDNYFMGIMRNLPFSNINTFQQAIENREIIVSEIERNKAFTISIEDNPVLIFYKIKK